MAVLSKPSQLKFRSPNPGATFPEDFKFITLPELCSDNIDEDRYKKVLPLVTLYIKTSAGHTEPQPWYSKKDQGSIKYDRILYAMDPLSPPGRNIVAIIIGKSTNIHFFDDVLTIRDTPHLGPGGVFAIEDPSNVDQFMGGSQVPLLFTPDSIVAIDMDGHAVPERPINTSSASQHAFCYSNVEVVLVGLTVQEVNCCGSLCDAYGMYDNSKFAQSCGCIMNDKYCADISGIFELVFKKSDPSGASLEEHVKDITSKKFTKMLFRGGNLPVGLTAACINRDRRTRIAFRQKAQAAVRFVNEGGASKVEAKRGFTVMGWVRRGKVADRGVDATTVAGQAQKTMADSSSLVLHVTSIVPTSDDVAKELAGDDTKLFDAEALLRSEFPGLPNPVAATTGGVAAQGRTG